MRTAPFATIVIPTFNQDSYLPQALDSLLAQTDSDWEAIIVNDGSTDNTGRIADDYAVRDSRFRCIHKNNGGVASALNTGLEHARGDWIHWLSSDDLFEPHKLAVNRKWIEQNPDSSFFFSYFTLLRESTGERERRELWGPLPAADHQLLTLFYRNYISGISICIRGAAWREIGFFDESLRYAQDYELWLRLLQKHRGVFIPEWTVVSRNHAAQGSETFPDACYYDTAKAALRFINEHSFSELLPFADLQRHETAKKAVDYALDVATDPTSFIYCLGPHTALLSRILEWVFSDACIHPDLQTLVKNRINAMSFAESTDDWTWMWRQLAIATNEESRVFRHKPQPHLALAMREWRSKQISDHAKQDTLRDYLSRFDGIADERFLPSSSSNSRIVFLVNVETEDAAVWLDVASRLGKRGFRPLILLDNGAGDLPTFETLDWFNIVRIAAFDSHSLPRLGDVELLVTERSAPEAAWVSTLSSLILEAGLCADEIESRVLSAFERRQPRRPVIFLERVTWGGGAERVVYDIVRHLNRKFYQPSVWTMFPDHTNPPALPDDVEIANLHASAMGDHAPTGETISPPPRLHRIYHRVVPLSLRGRLQLRQVATSLKRRIRAVGQGALRPRSISVGSVTMHSSITSPAELDFVASMRHHNPSAAGLARVVRGLGDGAVVVSVMEEAAVAAWLAQAEAPFPYIASLHTVESACLPDIYPGAGRLKAEKWLFSAACNRATAITMPTDGCMTDLAVNFSVSSSKIKKIPNPVDCSKVRWLSFQQTPAVERWKASSPVFRLVHVGRLDPQKNHSLLLLVCKELKRRGRAFSLAIVGDGRARPDIEKTVHEYELENEVILVGEQVNPFPWIAAADSLLLTSKFEAFALVLLEAMVCETPVISVDCPVGPAEVLNNGEFGLLVSPNDPMAMADAVERLINDPQLALRLTKSGHERAKLFDVKSIIPLWEALIDETPAIQEITNS
ncbi:glycosyltransferase [Rhizobium leguminosarum]|uniref:glycosyltransferase n=1 Tax=Rhizobium leguminosarum TaxID=384 RepID=UPI001C8FCF0E|nr:glycosyltransferase [Rhizobium leguminosarum]MBY2909021.1 glycosyltransferase [Rhizobium leguminosarum]MBY2949293.1 glycosyltransferase [Rhizobium leguminosarum]